MPDSPPKTVDRPPLSLALFAAICGAAVLLRLALIAFGPTEFVVAEDWDIAGHLARGDGYSYGHLGPTALKVPVYPLFLALFRLILPAKTAALGAILIQHALAAMVPWWLWKLGARTNRSAIGQWAGLAFLLHPSYLIYPSTLEATNLFVPLAVLWCLGLARVAARPTAVSLLALGAFAAIVTLTQAIASLPLAIAVCIALRRRSTTSTSRHTLLALAAFALALAPWTVRNAIAFHTFLPGKSPFWMNLYVSFTMQDGNLARFDLVEPATRVRVDSLTRTTNDVAMEPIYRDAVLQTLRAHPKEALIERTVIQAGLYWWVPPRYLHDNSSAILLARKLPVLLLNALTIPGLVIAWRRDRRLAVALIALLVYATTIYALTQVKNVRFKLDVEWTQLYAVGMLAQTLRQRRPVSTLACGAPDDRA